MHCEHTAVVTLISRGGSRKRVAEPSDDLEERKVAVGQRRSDEILISLRVPFEHVLEIGQKSRRSRFQELAGPPTGFPALILVVKAGRNWVVSVVDFLNQICKGQLELVCPQSSRFVLRCEAVARPEKRENIRGLSDQKITSPQERRSERRAFDGVAVENPHERWNAGALFFRLSRNVRVFRTGLLKGQPHELSAPLDGGPVVEFILHVTDSVRSLRAAEKSKGKASAQERST